MLFAGWIVYDLLWLSPLAKNEPVAVVISFALLMGVAWWLPHVMSNRAAVIHVGALLGTLMSNNVWSRIIPAQKKMVAAAREGREPDPVLAERAKFRSKHNTYLVIPVVMMMISNHYPVALLGENNWITLGVLTLVGWAVAHVIRKQ